MIEVADFEFELFIEWGAELFSYGLLTVEDSYFFTRFDFLGSDFFMRLPVEPILEKATFYLFLDYGFSVIFI